jgi:hypothetical protein
MEEKKSTFLISAVCYTLATLLLVVGASEFAGSFVRFGSEGAGFLSMLLLLVSVACIGTSVYILLWLFRAYRSQGGSRTLVLLGWACPALLSLTASLLYVRLLQRNYAVIEAVRDFFHWILIADPIQ